MSMILQSLLSAADKSELPTWLQSVLSFLVTAGLRLLGAACIVVGAVIIAWLLRIFIRRIVTRIVNGAKNKAHVDDTQALERSPLASA